MIKKTWKALVRRTLAISEARAVSKAHQSESEVGVTFYLVGSTTGLWPRLNKLASRYAVTGGMARQGERLVQVQAEGDPVHLQAFSAGLTQLALSRGIEHIEAQTSRPCGNGGFRKLTSGQSGGNRRPISTSFDPTQLGRSHEAIWDMLSRQASSQVEQDPEWVDRLDLALPREWVPFNFDKRFPAHAVTAGYSYAASMWSRIRFREALQAQAGTNWEFVLEDKNNGRDFARRLGLPLPELYQSEVALRDVRLRANRVVKPSNGAGARGVFICMQDGRIKDLRSKRIFRGNDEFLRRAQAVIDDGLVSRDAWNVEEFVPSNNGGLPNDLKFQCFYGHCPLMAEVKRDGGKAFCWWTPNGKPVDAGSFSGDEFVGEGAEPWLWALAERISRMIPAPFVRIDFLAGGEKIVFGEFTPRPGGVHEVPSRDGS